MGSVVTRLKVRASDDVRQRRLARVGRALWVRALPDLDGVIPITCQGLGVVLVDADIRAAGVAGFRCFSHVGNGMARSELVASTGPRCIETAGLPKPPW